MAWKRFGYICRKASVTLTTQEIAADVISRVENEPACSLYGGSINKNSLSRKILDKLAAVSNKDDAIKALEIYSSMDISLHLPESAQIKRVTTYLTFLTLTFVLISAIYQLFVVPSFMQAFDTFGLSVPSHLMFYRDYWHLFVIVIFVVLALSLVIGYTFRKLFKFNEGRANSLVLRFMAFRGIRASYLSIIDALLYPVGQRGRAIPGNNKVTDHLADIDSSKMDLSVEIQAIIEAEYLTLVKLCERQMRLISIAAALLIVAAIFLFLVSAYSPIFIFGEIV